MSAFLLLAVTPLHSNLESPYIQSRFIAPSSESAAALSFCNDMLVKVSRSFAAVIRQLPPTLLVDVLIFYLVLRALDTIEDDTRAFATHASKVEHLNDFWKRALKENVEDTTEFWSLEGVGEGDERVLLQQFPQVQIIFRALPTASQRIIADITERMALGMAEFVSKDLGQGTTDIQQYNRYCHFVAGLVGEGLSRLFAASGLEASSLASELRLSDQMGLFLQKTNIIRDYLEDYVDGRAFWPQSVWKKYSGNGQLGYFANPTDPNVRQQALWCLNELVTDALELVPDCLAYMERLSCVEIFRFCAIPQVMAIATLEKCYDNIDVFSGVVKIRKGLSCKLILQTNSIPQVHAIFYDFARAIIRKAQMQRKKGVMDPSFDRTVRICERIGELTNLAKQKDRHTKRMVRLGAGTLAATAILLPRLCDWALPKSATASSSLTLLCLQTSCLAASGLFYVYGERLASRSDLTRAELLEKKMA